jgi:hypothetical protein
MVSLDYMQYRRWPQMGTLASATLYSRQKPLCTHYSPTCEFKIIMPPLCPHSAGSLPVYSNVLSLTKNTTTKAFDNPVVTCWVPAATLKTTCSHSARCRPCVIPRHKRQPEILYMDQNREHENKTTLCLAHQQIPGCTV